MTLKKAISTFTCLCLLGLCGVESMEIDIAKKTGTFECDHSTMSYKIRITPSSSNDKINVICHMQDMSQDSSSESASLSLDARYKISNATWIDDAECVNAFLEKVYISLFDLKDRMPSRSVIEEISKDILCTKSRDVSKLSNGGSISDDKNSLNDNVCKNIKQNIDKIENNKKNLTFNNKEEFLNKQVDDIKEIQNISFKNCLLDNDFVGHFYEMNLYDFNTIEFASCTLNGVYTFADILSGFNIQNLSIKNCGLTDDDLIEIFLTMDGRKIHTLDLSNNKLTSAVIDGLRNIIYKHGFSIDYMNFSCNKDLTRYDVQKIGGVYND